MWDGSCARLINIFVFQIDTLIRWRRGRDSNPRYPCEYAAFRVRCFQPLSHLSEAVSPSARCLIRQASLADPVLEFPPLVHVFCKLGPFANLQSNLPPALPRT